MACAYNCCTWGSANSPLAILHGRREMEKMKDAVNAAAGGEGVPTRRIAGDAGREYILQTEEDTKAKAALEAGQIAL